MSDLNEVFCGPNHDQSVSTQLAFLSTVARQSYVETLGLATNIHAPCILSCTTDATSDIST